MSQKKNYMFTPGPTMVPQEVQLAEAQPMIHHRTDQFSDILRRVSERLMKLYGTEQDVYTIMGTGTAAMEAAVANVCSPGDTVICAPAGKFGMRWAEICETYGCEVVNIDIEWGQSLTADMVRGALEENPGARALYMTHCETSTGALSDVEEIAAVTRQTDTLLAVDAITSIGVHPYRMDDWGVDITVCGSQKGCMVPPGLSFIAASERSWNVIEACESPAYYLDLVAMRDKWTEHQTPYTGGVTLVRALDRALEMMFEEGLETVYERHATLAKATRAAVDALGLELVADNPANCVTAAYGPEGMDTGDLKSTMMDDYGVTIAGGQKHLSGKIIRLGHMGYVSEEDLLVLLGTLERALKDHDYDFDYGSGVAAAMDVLA